jgi:hypothetical protein
MIAKNDTFIRDNIEISKEIVRYIAEIENKTYNDEIEHTIVNTF